MDYYCYLCHTGTCLANGAHADHHRADGAKVPATTIRGGTALCTDCANNVADSMVAP